MADKSFFDEQSEQSLVKSTIVAKYFEVWANVIISTQKKYPHLSEKIAYIDLFAGPGRYADGKMSTPLQVLKIAINHPEIGRRLEVIFNDKDENNASALEAEISKLPGIEKLKYKPLIEASEVGDEIVEMFEEMSLIPTLFFVDPWGYKGLSLRLVNSVLKNWGCDCIFFFNYNRINMGLTNAAVKEHMDALFGEQRANDLRDKLTRLDPYERELIIIEELCQALKSYGSRYTLPFRFKDKNGSRTSHHLIFVSKHPRGYEIMKEIMAKESSDLIQGVPSFEYSPADILPQQSLLFQLSRPLNDLADRLKNAFAGVTLRMIEIYREHNVDTPYIKKNYKDALLKLEKEGIIKASHHRKGTFGDQVEVSFPIRRKRRNK